MNISKKDFKRGGVSMFIVIVTTTLIAIITAGFVRLMLRDQQNASRQDLSQSAYDSAMAGVEDAKRFVSQYNQACSSATYNEANCNRYKNALAASSGSGANSCFVIAGAIGTGNGRSETLIQSSRVSGRDSQLDQAYTCLKVTKDTADFVGQASEGRATIIPLKATGNFSKIRISWHSRVDLPSSGRIHLDATTSPSNPSFTDWGDRPALIKAQFYGYREGGDFDSLNTGFRDDGVGIDQQKYFPVSTGFTNTALPASKRTGSAGSTIQATPVRCSNNLDSNVYACSIVVTGIPGATIRASSVKAFLRLTPMYRQANFKVELLDSSDNAVLFEGAQPTVDSTGRANDMLRRVEARLEYDTSGVVVPDFAISQEGSESLCKNFSVTNISNTINDPATRCR